MRILNAKILSAVGLSAAMFLTSLAPAAAMTPIPMPKPAQTAMTDVTQVQYRDRDDRRYIRRQNQRRNEARYYNGHRGYSERRPGYRRHNGAWFPLAAFATGAIIGGAVSADRPVRVGGSHVQWCQNQYRSYRSSDNTFQPNNGPRRACVSPY